jgi:hypothetical protein
VKVVREGKRKEEKEAQEKAKALALIEEVEKRIRDTLEMTILKLPPVQRKDYLEKHPHILGLP